MHLKQTDNTLVVSDRPGCIWLLGTLFVASGTFVLAMAVFSDDVARFKAWERLAMWAIGLAHLAGGLWFVRSHPATRTIFVKQSGKGIHTMRRPGDRSATVTEFDLSEVRGLEILHSKDSDGDPMYQIRLWLSRSRSVLLHGSPVHGESYVRKHADEIEAWLARAR